jgi:hypothetical protein
MSFTIVATPVEFVADSVFEKKADSQVDSLRLRAEASLDLQNFARWLRRPMARLPEACKEINVTRRSIRRADIPRASIELGSVLGRVVVVDLKSSTSVNTCKRAVFADQCRPIARCLLLSDRAGIR